MTAHGCHVNGMCGKACCTMLVGLILTFTICNAKCVGYNLNDIFTKYLLKDHWFAVKNFTSPAESEKKEHIFLSVVNTLCSTWKQNKDRLVDECRKTIFECNDSLDKVTRTFEDMLNHTLDVGFKEVCDQLTCNDSYRTDFIRPAAFLEKYYKICSWNPPRPAKPDCPKIQTSETSTSSSSTFFTDMKPPAHRQPNTLKPLDTVLLLFIVLLIAIISFILCYLKRGRHCNHICQICNIDLLQFNHVEAERGQYPSE